MECDLLQGRISHSDIENEDLVLKHKIKGDFFFHFQMYLYFQKLSTIKVVDKAFQTSIFGFWTFETIFDAFKEF